MVTKVNASNAIEFIEEMTRDCDTVQEKVLAEILERNVETEYLKRHHMEGKPSRRSFKCRVPVVSYEDIKPDIERIANGDFSPILSGEPVSEFLTSSGTSGGERKLMPTIKEDMDRRQLIYNLQMPLVNLYVPGMDKGKVLHFLFIKAETKTPGGLVARPVLTSYYKSDQFRNRPFDPYNQLTSLNESVLCLDSFQSMYTQMLSGLYERLEVLRVGAVFASGLLRAIRFLHLHYRELCRDIATGTLSPKITDIEVVRAMSRIVRPDPDLARVIEEECSKENWEGIIKRVWPKTKYLDVIVTGAMAQYIPTLDFYSGGLPKVSSMYASSESFFGINLRPMADPSEVTYTIMPNMAYFEFIPLDSSGSTDFTSLVDLANVEVGREYELVVTTYAGLYRYRVGDVLLVTGFHNAAPEFRFVRRKNVLLSIDSDKTDEAELQRAVDRASALLRRHANTAIVEYTAYPDTNSAPGHYVVYVELMQPNGATRWPDDGLLSKCCLEMEELLNTVYRQCRVADGSVGPLEIRVVRPGTFEELMDYAISRGASINQYKMPRCVSSMPVVELLNGRVVSAHFSPSPPQWAPSVGGGAVARDVCGLGLGVGGC